MKATLKYIFVSLLALTVSACSSKKNNNKKADAKATVSVASDSTHINAQPIPKAKYVEQASFTTLDGNKTVAVSDFKGKVVVIDLWETWCKPCIASFPTLEKLQKDFPKHLKILAVTAGFTDTKADAKKFVDNHDYELTFLFDSNKLHKKLHVSAIPYRIFISPNGNFIKTEMGNHGPKGDYRQIASVVKKYFPSASASKKQTSK